MPGQPIEQGGLKLGLVELYDDAKEVLIDWTSRTIGSRRGSKMPLRMPSTARGYEEIPMGP
jgi:hypothetical protein